MCFEIRLMHSRYSVLQNDTAVKDIEFPEDVLVESTDFTNEMRHLVSVLVFFS